MARPILRAALAIASTVIAVAGAHTPALAGWGPEPVQVYATTNTCPQVALCDDGRAGAIVFWQENLSGSAGPLRVAHLLATGDVDPAWPSPVDVLAASATRTELRAIPDGAGGAYVVWVDGTTTRVLRVQSDGTVAAGWASGGRALSGSTLGAQVISDGAGGLYACWVKWGLVVIGTEALNQPCFHLERLGPDGQAWPGWPGGGRTIGLDTEQRELVSGCAVALDPGGDVWAAWIETSFTTSDSSASWTLLPGTSRVLRLTSQGVRVPTWPIRGVALAAFPSADLPEIYAGSASAWWIATTARFVAVAPDARGGACVLAGAGTWDPDAQTEYFAPRLYRVDAGGTMAAGWPANGIAVDDLSLPLAYGAGTAASYELVADSRGGVHAGWAPFYVDAPATFEFVRVTEDGAALGSWGGSLAGREAVATAEGKLLVADFYPHGPTGMWDDIAHVRCGGPESPVFAESHLDVVVPWYGDAGVAALQRGGAIFAWSQCRERFGIYAVRLNEAGLVTDVPASPAPSVSPRLALRFAPGAGIRASLALAGVGEARLLLADVTGRAVARETFALDAGAREWTIGGTDGLAPGLYFARVTRSGESLAARVVVTR